MKYCLFIFLISSLASFAQVEEELTVLLREVRVHVVDRKGNPVNRLKMEDFIVEEDKTAQEIDFFEEVDLFAKDTGARELPPKGNFAFSHQDDPRYLVLVIDSSNMTQRSFKKFVKGAVDFVTQVIHDNDVVKIVQIDQGMKHLTPFTTDRNELKRGLKRARYTGRLHKDLMLLERSIIETIFAHLDAEEAESAYRVRHGAAVANNGGVLAGGGGMEEMYEKQVNMRVQEKERIKKQHFKTFYMNMLSLTQILKPITGSKSVILMTGGTYLETSGVFDSTKSVSDRLGRELNSANVTIYSVLNKPTVSTSQSIINLAGRPLESVSNPEINANFLTKASTYPPGEDTGVPSDNTILENAVQIESGPSAFAENTGGFFRGTSWVKDIDDGIEDLLYKASQYYRLAYSTDNRRNNSKVKISLRPELRSLGYKLIYGKRFTVPKPYLELKKEEQALEFESILLYSRSFRNDLQAEFGYNLFHSQTGGFNIPVYVKIPEFDFPENGIEVGFALMGENYDIVDITRSEIGRHPYGGEMLLYDVLLSKNIPRAVRYYIRDLDTAALSFHEYTLDPVGEERPSNHLSPIMLTQKDESRMYTLNHFREGTEKADARRVEDPFSLGDSNYKPGLDHRFVNPEYLGFFFHLYDAPKSPRDYGLELTVTRDGKPVPLTGTLNKIHSISAETHHYYGKIETQSLDSGQYEIAIEITEKASGEKYQRSRKFQLVESKD